MLLDRTVAAPVTCRSTKQDHLYKRIVMLWRQLTLPVDLVILEASGRTSEEQPVVRYAQRAQGALACI